MLKHLPFALILISSALADLTVPTTITGVSTGSLDTNGNIVANIDRILATLNQFQSIVQSLYYIQSPEYIEAADNFRYVMDSLVESGSPIFQALSNVAKVSSGNIERSFDAIRSDIDTAVGLDEEHQFLVDQTRQILGNTTATYFGSTLEMLALSLANVTELLDNIQKAVVQIRELNPRTQAAAVKALLPNSDIKALNAILRQYIQIGDAAVPEIRSVVSRIQTADSFLSRTRSLFNSNRQSLTNFIQRTTIPYLNNSVINVLANGLTDARKLLVERSLKDAVSVANLLLNDNMYLKETANQTAPVLQALAINLTNNVDFLQNQVRTLRVSTDLPFVVMNMTEELMNNVTQDISLMLTQRVNKSDSCFARVNYPFDSVPRTLYDLLYRCLSSTTTELAQMAFAMNSVVGLLKIDVGNELSSVENCVNSVTRYSTDMTIYQAATCLNGVRNYIGRRRVYVQQLANYQRLLENEVSYSAGRYDFCLTNSLRQAQTMVNYLKGSFSQCVGIAPTVTPYKFRVGGKVTIRFG